MADPHYTQTTTTTSDLPPANHTTVIERRGGGGGLLIGLAVLIAVLIGGYFLFAQSRNDAIRTDAVAGAAKSVGDTADKAGAAIDSATK